MPSAREEVWKAVAEWHWETVCGMSSGIERAQESVDAALTAYAAQVVAQEREAWRPVWEASERLCALMDISPTGNYALPHYGESDDEADATMVWLEALRDFRQRATPPPGGEQKT